MKCMNFPAKWIDWMSCCLSSATTSILVNGSPVDLIDLKRGVRQGDPISLYLFVFAVEGLKCILDRSMDLGFTQGFSYSDSHDPISMLQFADDTILYIPYDIEQLKNMTPAQVVGCRIDSFPMKYLGLPLTYRKLSCGSWDYVIERIPRVVETQLESYMVRFLWKGDVNSRVLSKVSWGVICKDFNKGGLGISKLNIRNKSLLFKWIWKLRMNNKNSLWFNVTSCCSNVVDWDCLLNGDVKKMSFIWKGIRKSCCNDLNAWGIFVANLKYSVGVGDSVSLWHDNWMCNGPACNLYPRLYNLLNQK
ncbi:uncharacterized protein LOC126661782 [Mercurialis annua]|uniref:uncharacterized protein LOC126661782 n=1 Tax=Mercurialis annua TaxID=3986 RepID=UPI00215EE8C3|nr:uncharacterized protein LOC126661782 [Mercurialis annua]